MSGFGETARRLGEKLQKTIKNFNNCTCLEEIYVKLFGIKRALFSHLNAAPSLRGGRVWGHTYTKSVLPECN